ncbi:MAG: DNA translocase FtsK [Bacteroidales bacterium]|nr:DNA translocase FtsK [Bacteroidales bacterium]
MRVTNHVVSSKSKPKNKAKTLTRHAKVQQKAAAPKQKKSKPKSAPKQKTKRNGDGFWKTITGQRAVQVYGVILMAFAIMLALSIVSFYFHAHNNITYVLGDHDAVEPQNVALGAGAWLAYFFVDQMFGVFAIGFPFLFFLYGLAMTFGLRPLPLMKTTLNVLLTMAWFSLLFGMFFRDGDRSFVSGAFGNYSAEGLMHLGTFVAVLIIIALFAIILVLFYKPLVIALKELSLASFDQLQQSLVELKQHDPDAEVADERRKRRERKKGKKEETTSEREDLDDLYISDHGCLSKEYGAQTHTWEIERSDEAKADADEQRVALDVPDEVPFELVTPNSSTEILPDNPEGADSADDTPEEKHPALTPEEVRNLPPFDPRAELPTYEFPPIDLLNDYPAKEANEELMRRELLDNKLRIESTLKSFNIPIQRISATVGPTVTLYEIVPAEGVRISKIKNLEDDIALSLAALGIRIIAPIPGRGTIGIEVPNKNANIVSMKEIINSDKFQNNNYALPIGLGRTISNEPFVVDLAKMPHLLVAGATGQGKSVGLNAIITSLLYTKHPCEMKFVLIDPKKVEFTLYSVIENYYLAALPDNGEPIITDTKKVVRTLNSLCKEMDDRYDLLKLAKMRNIKEYNAKFCARELSPAMGHRYLPYIVLVIDEFGDLIMTAGREVEQPLARLAQLARAIGIHLVIATQRPSVNIITGSIKANFPARIAFRVQSSIDSRTILDTTGANQLIGKGDMLISTGSDIVRLQCAFVDTPEVEKISTYIEQKSLVSPLLEPYSLPDVPEPGSEPKDDFDNEPSSGEIDPLFVDAAVLTVQTQQGSTSNIQRRMKLGYNRSGRIMDQLEEFGIVGPARGSKPREVLVKTESQLRQMLADKGML